MNSGRRIQTTACVTSHAVVSGRTVVPAVAGARQSMRLLIPILQHVGLELVGPNFQSRLKNWPGGTSIFSIL